MTAVQELIIIFTKYPQPGRSKTRLIPFLGPEKAAELQRRMAASIYRTSRELCQKSGGRIEIHYQGGTEELMRQWLGEFSSYHRQTGQDLGERMSNALQQHLGDYRAVLLVGTDCPAIDSLILTSGFSALQTHDVVIGPAHDGGYYLIGVGGHITPEAVAECFRHIDWGTPEVLKQTTSRLKALNLRYTLLEKLHDIDTPEDLRHLDNYPGTE